ncbi:MAG TPA: squalene synthase HpnC [Acidimicrobiales bacterium]|jgi:squalene synthase HpnC|nr:squalene synthase HpnC [Acidimicrobiales bacterium]
MSAFGLDAPVPTAPVPTVATVPALPGVAPVLAKARQENFPVALWFLPARVRARLLAVYGFARLVDDVGDEGAGTGAAARLARLDWLDWLEQDLERAATGSAVHPLLQRLTPLLVDLGLPLDPFRRLIEASRRDQQVRRYRTFDDLQAYCRLSATPVGELVLGIFEVSTVERVAWSDDICTALQLLEHLQDVGEDAGRGRVYLPAEDLARFGCPESDLDAPTASRALREVVAFETDRSRHLLRQATALAGSLPFLPRLAVAGFAAGGLATVDALVEADYEVLGETRRPARGRLLVHLARLSAVRSSAAKASRARGGRR